MSYSSSYPLQSFVGSRHSNSCLIEHFLLLLLSHHSKWLSTWKLYFKTNSPWKSRFISSILANFPTLIKHCLILLDKQESWRTEQDNLRWESRSHSEGLRPRYGSYWIKLPHFWFFLSTSLIKSKMLFLTAGKLSIKNTHCLRKESFFKYGEMKRKNKKLKLK